MPKIKLKSQKKNLPKQVYFRYFSSPTTTSDKNFHLFLTHFSPEMIRRKFTLFFSQESMKDNRRNSETPSGPKKGVKALDDIKGKGRTMSASGSAVDTKKYRHSHLLV